ncbi:CoA transferase [Rubrobacter calidifluminis]|uniref:CoA transferase n=1 Tax=Rubrobacter calidifluminis TaxID=1392640 RepID=UPI002362D990|nr:CoA transferase [Rubrobacter calidifluminis]
MSAPAGILRGVRAVSLCLNIPGPVAASRLHSMGAEVSRVEPPEGDPLGRYCPLWYRDLTAGQRVLRLDLKRREDRESLEGLLAGADLLLTSSRPAALRRLGLGWEDLHARYPRLSHVAITGHPPPEENRPGHDLTYQASLGLLDPPHLPRTLLADLAGAERAVSAALALLLERERGGEEGAFAAVPLQEAAASFAAPLRYGLTAPGGLLGGAFAGYGLYRTQDGWVALAALEPHFQSRLAGELGLEELSHEALQEAFSRRSAREWERWARERDLPLSRVRGAPGLTGTVSRRAASGPEPSGDRTR